MVSGCQLRGVPQFYGNNKQELQLQSGNAEPVRFAKRIAMRVREALEVMDGHGSAVMEAGEQMRMFKKRFFSLASARQLGILPQIEWHYLFSSLEKIKISAFRF